MNKNNIEVYTKEGCSACVLMKSYLEKVGLSFIEHRIGKDVSVDDVLLLHPGVSLVPAVVVDGVLVGEDDELASILGLVDHTDSMEEQNRDYHTPERPRRYGIR